jgi:EAL domain-containing protein (putative c-di-GMP-specific phosphodiesterase class I)
MYVIDFDVAAIVLSGITLFVFYERKRKRFGPGKSFIPLAWAALGSSVASAISSAAANALPEASPMAVIATVTVFYLFHLSTPFFAARYVLDTGGIYPSTAAARALLSLPWAIALLAIVSNPFTRLLSFVDASGSYRHGPAFLGLYALAFVYLAVLLWAIFLRRDSYTRSQRRAFLAAVIAPTVAIVAQNLLDGLMLESLGVSLSTLFVLLAIQNASELLDGQSGLYHREAFVQFLGQAFDRNERFSVLFAYSAELADFQGSIEPRTYRALVGAVSKWLSEAGGKDSTPSWLRTGVFAILFKRRSRASPIGNLALELLERSAKPWSIGPLTIELPFKIFILNCPEDAGTVAEAADYIDQLADLSARMSHRHISTRSDFVTGMHKRESAIAAALERCLESGRPELRFQPIYSIAERRAVALEVLVGLSLGDRDMVLQSEVLAMADRMGVSRALTALVMDRAFEWYGRNELERRGIRQLQLRLVSSMSLDLDWPGSVIRAAEERDMDLSRVCLEITETTVARLGMDLAVNMELLAGKKVAFALDDFGTGYTNLAQLMRMPFSLIKFDKKVIQPGLATLKGRQLIQGSIDLFKRQGRAVAAEGVESAEHSDILALMACDYLQGYHFGRPVCGDELLARLDDERPR